MQESKNLKKRIIIPVSVAVLVIMLLPAPGRSGRAVAATGPRVAITIDDGYNFDHRIVDFLTSQGIQASAFVVGAWAQNNTGLLKEMNGLGWDICNHTQNHPILTKIPDDRIRAEIATCQSIITSATGQNLPFFRPPGGVTDGRVNNVVASMGYIPVLWNFDSQDAVATNASIQDRVNFIVRSAADGNVILFHFGGKGTLELMTGIVQGLQQRGFSFVTLKEMYGWRDVIRGGESGPGMTETFTRFYFPEGNTGEGFDEWILAANPGDKTADLKLRFFSKQASAEKDFKLEGGQRISISVNESVPWQGDVSAILESSLPVAAERMLYFNHGRGFSGGSLAPGQKEASRRYYFAEGSTRRGFDEWLVLFNPSSNQAADVKVDLYEEGGTRENATLVVPPMERITKKVNNLMSEPGDVSLRLSCEIPVLAERTEYFNYNGGISGSSSGIGSHDPDNQWYFAEGSTRHLFESYLALFNPCRYATLVTVKFAIAGGEARQEVFSVDPMQKRTLHLNEYLPENIDYAVQVESLLPIVAERSTYFQSQNVSGGYCSSGANSPEGYWIFPEGSTAPGSSEWLALFNPGESEQEVAVSYMVGGQGRVERAYLLPKQGRITIDVGAEVGQDNAVSIEVKAPQGVVAERSIYFSRSTR